MDFTSDDFNRQFSWDGPLGAFWAPDQTQFRLWAPQAAEVRLKLYPGWEPAMAGETRALERRDRGVWEVSVSGDLSGRYYTFETVYEGRGAVEAVDPYARAVGPQGRRGFLFDPRKTDPEGWGTDVSPVLHHVNDSIIYELQVRDLSSLDSSGIRNRGGFLGLTEEGTRSPDQLATGLDHIAELGVTHVHLLPIFDFDEVDDLAYDPAGYNWGYNPRNFNALKGAFGSDSRHPDRTVAEFKKAVQALHRKGLRVVMDVVYNHTYSTADSNLNKVYPFYYYRMYGPHFSNGSGCGNELATERPMVRRMILDSLRYWKEEFHLDGFRFDLMGLYDIETMNQIARELRRDDPGFLLYGEGWTGGLSTLPDEQKAVKANAPKVREIAFFSDDSRDAVKGHVFDAGRKGFCNGGEGMDETIKFTAAGCIHHPQISYQKLLYAKEGWAQGPHQTVNYVAAHDNHTLWDKLAHTNPHDSEEVRIRMAKLAHGIVFTSQGIAFLHAGEEFLRTKHGVENSYNSSDLINGLDWSAKARHKDVFDYIKGLIALRRAHPALRLRSADQVRTHLEFLELLENRMVSWVIHGRANGDPSEKLLVILNGHHRPREVHLPSGNWQILADHQRAGTESLGTPSNRMVSLVPHSLMVLAASS